MAGAGYQKDPSKARHAFEFSLDKQEVSRLSLTKFMIFIQVGSTQTAGKAGCRFRRSCFWIIASEKNQRRKRP
jgi:hypothetical protein